MVSHVTRRRLGPLLTGAALLPRAAAAERKNMLVIGLDIVDTITLDPARQSNYTPPLTLAACYDTLVTMRPGQYEDVVPRLATAWERTPDGKGWRFTLHPDATFSSGNKVTPEDCRFTFERILAVDGGAAQFLDNIAAVAASGPDTFDIILRRPNEPVLGTIAAPEFGVLEKAIVQAHGGTDQPGANRDDTATEWLNQNSAGSGAYVLNGWARHQSIRLAANPHAWRGSPGFDWVLIRHLPDPTAQLRALQRGDIDVAFNLIPEQIVKLQTDPGVHVESTTGLDFVYLALNGDQTLNKALAIKEARQAIGYAIDYDGLINQLLGGKAVRPASFLPIGVRGSTAAVAEEIGFRQDLDRAKMLLGKAGFADGFEFELSYSDDAIAGLPYAALVRRIRADLGRVGIKVKLNAADPTNLRGRFLAGKAQAVVAFWNAPVVENTVWASASVDRVAKRIDFQPSAELVQLIGDAATNELDKAEQSALWVEYQKAMVDAANLIVLFQPIYQVGVRNRVAAFPLTGAGWMAELGDVRPA